jgi:hypothetical protein
MRDWGGFARIFFRKELKYFFDVSYSIYPILHRSASCILQVEVNKKKVTYNVKLLTGKALLAEKKLSFIMKLFHFVCEKRLLNWLPISLQQAKSKTKFYQTRCVCGLKISLLVEVHRNLSQKMILWNFC